MQLPGLMLFSSNKHAVMFLQGLGSLQNLDLSLNGLSTVPLGLLDEVQGLRYTHTHCLLKCCRLLNGAFIWTDL